jgi:hypothetical protein
VDEREPIEATRISGGAPASATPRVDTQPGYECGQPMRMARARRYWGAWVALGIGSCALAVFLALTPPGWLAGVIWAPAGIGLTWLGVRGFNSAVILNEDTLIIRNSIRTYTIPRSRIESFVVSPPVPRSASYLTTQAVVKVEGRAPIALTATNLQGFIWNAKKRWQAVAEFIEPLNAELHRTAP